MHLKVKIRFNRVFQHHDKIKCEQAHTVETCTVTLHPIYLVSLHFALFKRCVRLMSYGSQTKTHVSHVSPVTEGLYTTGLDWPSVPLNCTRNTLIPNTGQEVWRTMKINTNLPTVWLPVDFLNYDFKKVDLKIKIVSQLMH